MGDMNVEALEKKCKTMFDLLKELNKEVKQNKQDTDEIKQEIELVKNKLDKMESELSKMLGEDVLVIKQKKQYTDAEIYECRMKSSLNRAAAYLGVSRSTVQRACARYIRKQFEDMEV